MVINFIGETYSKVCLPLHLLWGSINMQLNMVKCKLWRLQRMLRIHQEVQEAQHLVLMSKRWKFLVSETFRNLEENLELTAKQEALPAAVASNAMIHHHLAGWFIVSIETWEKWKRITKLRQDLNEGKELLKTSSLLPQPLFLCVSSSLVYLYSASDYFYTT